MKQMSLSLFYWFLRNHLVSMEIHSIPLRVPNSIDYYIIVQLNGKLELVILLDETEYKYICTNAIDRKTHSHTHIERERVKKEQTHWNGKNMVCELLWTEVVHINNIQYVRTVLQSHLLVSWWNNRMVAYSQCIVGMKKNTLSQPTNGFVYRYRYLVWVPFSIF